MGDVARAGLAVLLPTLLFVGCASSDSVGPPPTTAASTPQTPTSTTTAAGAGDASATTMTRPVSPEALTIDVDGLERHFLLHVPSGLDGRAALVIDLHGFGSTPEIHEMDSGMTELSDVEGFIVAQPYARGGVPAWNPQPGTEGAASDIAFIRALVEAVTTTHRVDEDRIYVTGHSNGGGMAHRVACDAADLVSAVATVAGQYPVAEACDPAEPVSVLAIHGTADRVVPYDGVTDFLPPVADWVDGWVERVGCGDSTVVVDAAVTVEEWVSCDGGAKVEFVSIAEAGHDWPVRPAAPFDASRLIWSFFEEQAGRG